MAEKSDKKKGARLHDNDDEATSYQPPKLPRGPSSLASSRRLIIILEHASLETVKVCGLRSVVLFS